MLSSVLPPDVLSVAAAPAAAASSSKRKTVKTEQPQVDASLRPLIRLRVRLCCFSFCCCFAWGFFMVVIVVRIFFGGVRLIILDSIL